MSGKNFVEQKMCYSGVPYWVGSTHEKRQRRRRYVVHVTRVQATATSTESRVGVGMVKQCICSPTIHPGSFRCRRHHADYKWEPKQPNQFGASVAKAL